MSTLSRYVLADCNLSGNIGSFFATFPGAVTVGSFPANGDAGCLTSMAFNNCVVLTSLTITSTTPTVPEPSGVSLLGSGVLGLAGVLRKRWNGVIPFVLLIVVTISTSSARADATYSFGGINGFDGTGVEFSFTEPTLITTTGAFTASFMIGSTPFSSAFFDASNDCFSFSTSTAADCALSASGTSFYAPFPGAITDGLFVAPSGANCQASATLEKCVVLTSVTISSTTPAVPEPPSVLLLGSGVLSLAGVVRKRWQG